MSSPNYDNNEPNVARGNAVGNNSGDADATRSLSWDSAWQPDRDEDYGTPVSQYSGPGVFPPTPLPMQPTQSPQPQQLAQHPYAQAAQNLPVSGYPNNPAPGYPNPPLQGYSTPSAPNYNAPPAPYAPVTIYQGDQPMTPLQKPAPLTDQQTYRGYVSPDQQYNGQPLPQSPSTRPVVPWFIWLVVGIILFAVLSSWGWWGFWPIYGFWPLFIFWPLFALGRWGRYGGRWRNRRRW